MIVRVIVVLNRAVVYVDSESQDLYSGVLFSIVLTRTVIFHVRR